MTDELQGAKLHCMKTVTLYCEAGKHEWDRPSQRGRRPINCPEHTDAVVTPSTPKNEEAKVQARIRALELARQAKADNIAARERERDEARNRAREDAKVRITKVEAELSKAMDEEQKLFAKIDALDTKGKTHTTAYTTLYEKWTDAGVQVDKAINRILQLSAVIAK